MALRLSRWIGAVVLAALVGVVAGRLSAEGPDGRGTASPIPAQLPELAGEAKARGLQAGAAVKASATSEERARQARTPQATAPSPEPPLKPVPEASSSGPASIEAASFKEISPGVSTLEDVQKAWGPPKDAAKKGNLVTHLYRVEPFERIEVSFFKGKVTSIVIRLDRSFPANAVAQQLELGAIRPVLVSNTLGEILGQSFPERGVLFAFEPAPQGAKPTMKVSQIILEPVTAEPFVLRAETHLDTGPDSSLRDLDQAIRLAPTNARAHWLRARALAATDDPAKAATAADESVRLEPDNPRYRVTRAQILGQLGRFAEAMQEAERAVASSEKRPHVKARALCLLGDMAASGAQPDYKRALSYHAEAIKVADTLTGSPHPAIRLPAKEILVDAHLGAAQDIAWGSWNQKELALGKWLQRASAAAEDLIRNDGGSPEYRLRVATRGLTAYVGLRGKLDPAEMAEEASKVGQELIASASDPAQKRQLQWELGMALYDAVQVYQMRKDQQTALKYGQQAASLLEQGIAQRQNHPADSYFLGRLYFRLGAIHAVGEQKDHRSAVAWFDKARPLLENSSSRVDGAERGRLGETLVSMGVSYWEVGQRDKSVDLTSRGVSLMEQSVKEGALDRSSLEIPYSNLANMYRQQGKTDEANRYLRKASRDVSTTQR